MVKPLPIHQDWKVKIFKGIALIVIGLVVIVSLKSFINFLETRLEGFKDAAGAATVTYYSMEGCPHCKEMKPKWEEFKALAAKSGGSIETKEFSADNDQTEISKAKPAVQGFPTLHVSFKGKVTEYKGERSASALMAFVQKTMA